MGDIRNATAKKFGIWVRKVTGEYDFTKKYGKTAGEAFSVIRDELCKLVDAGETDDYTAIRNNKIAPIVRFKILSMYYPNKFLTIHSERHLLNFCEKANVPFTMDDDELVLQRKLILWKNSQTKIRDYSLLEYVAYLYENVGLYEKMMQIFFCFLLTVIQVKRFMNIDGILGNGSRNIFSVLKDTGDGES